MTPRLQLVLLGAAAGAAGTTVLNRLTYVDMAARGRPASSTTETTVEKLSEVSNVPVAGDEDARENRICGLGPSRSRRDKAFGGDPTSAAAPPLAS